jgi:hypothetical protein
MLKSRKNQQNYSNVTKKPAPMATLNNSVYIIAGYQNMRDWRKWMDFLEN